MVNVPFFSLTGVVLEGLSHEGFTVFNPSKGDQVSPVSQKNKPQCQALWVVAFVLK